MNRDDNNFPNLDPVEIHDGPDLPERLLSGVEKVAEFVLATYGPNGGYAAFKAPHSRGRGTKDGVTAAAMLGGGFVDPVENYASDAVKQASGQTNMDAGDGTTVSALLTASIARLGFKALKDGADSDKLGKGIHRAVSKCVEAVKAMAIPADAGHLRKVALTSMNGNVEVATIISEAMEAVGPEGSVAVATTREKTTRLDFDPQFFAHMGYLNDLFINVTDHNVCAMQFPLVLLTDATLAKSNDLLPFVQYAISVERPLLVIAGNVTNDAMNLLVSNAMRGHLMCAVQLTKIGHDGHEWLNDLAAYTGAKVMMKGNAGGSLDVAAKDPAGWLGSAAAAIVRADSIGIKRGAGDFQSPLSPDDSTGKLSGYAQLLKCFKEAATRVPERVATLSALAVSDGTSLQDREKIEHRITMLDRGRATIYVGTGGVSETQSLKDLIEDGIRATRCAAEEGILPGGGIAMFRISTLEIPEGIHKDEAKGWEIVRETLQAPIRRLAKSAGMDADAILAELLDKPENHGFDFREEKGGDMIEMGIIDTAKVIRCAMQNSASAAVTLLQTRQLASPIPGGHRI